MQTSKCRVRIKDIKAGKVIYKAHPIFGIEKLVIMGRPYQHPGIGLFMEVKCSYLKSGTVSESLGDAGILKGVGYNFKRSFFKRKHAEDWCERMKTDPSFINQHAEHVKMCNTMNEYDNYYRGY